MIIFGAIATDSTIEMRITNGSDRNVTYSMQKFKKGTKNYQILKGSVQSEEDARISTRCVSAH